MIGKNTKEPHKINFTKQKFVFNRYHRVRHTLKLFDRGSAKSRG